MRSLLKHTKLRLPSDAVETVDLDVTPVMNVFVILIPFLITMVVFTHLAVLRFSLPPNVGAGLDGGSGKPKVKLTVVLTTDHIALTLGETLLDSIPLSNGTFDLNLLATRLSERRPSLELQDEAVVAVRDEVAFDKVVQVMDRCREAGFIRIGLSQATVNAHKGV